MAAVVLLVVASLLTDPVPVMASEACRDCLRAGAASVPLRVPPGTPLGGYGGLRRRRLLPDILGRGPAFWFKASTGTLDPLSVRTLVLDDGAARIVWVTLDVVAVDRAFTEQVRARMGTDAGTMPVTLIVSASHTHAGPGAFLESRVMGVVAVDRFDPSVRDVLLSSVSEAITRAARALRPAQVAASTLQLATLVKGRLGRPVDPEVVVMKIVDLSGAPIALLWNQAIHGTMLSPGNLAFSGDVMGLAANALERDLGVPALFVNGAVGDVSPSGHGREAALAASGEIARAVRGAWSRLDAGERTRLITRTLRVALPAPSVSLHNCAGGWLPRLLRLPLDGALPRETVLTAAAVGDTVWVTVPGELESRLGLSLKRAAGPRWKHPFVAGVSNDYLGYFVTADDYERPGYVTCASLYGRDGGDRLTAAGAELLGSLARPARGVTP